MSQKDDGQDNSARLNRRSFLRMAGTAGAAFAGGFGANFLRRTPEAPSGVTVASDTFDATSATDSTRLRSELQAHIVGIPGITNVTIIDDDDSPHHNGIYRNVYNRLLTLLPENQRKEFPKPTAVAFDSTDDNAWNVTRTLREKGLIAITSSAYDTSDDKLAYIFGHELGHALYKYNAKLAEDMGGLNNPAVQPLLKKIKNRVDKLFQDRDEAAGVYNTLCSELMADGISFRISGKADPAIGWLKESNSRNEATSADDFIGHFVLPTNSKREIKRDLLAIQERIRAEGVVDHPSNAERKQYLELLSQSASMSER